MKAGVFSPAVLAPRVHEIENAIAVLDPRQVVNDLRQREIAALAALAEAMDRSLEQAGLTGRGGEPRRMISLRLRAHDKLRRAVAEYEQAREVESASVPETPADAPEPSNDTATSIVDAIAQSHQRESIDLLEPCDFDPERFLRAIITSADESVTVNDILRARRILSRRSKSRAKTCVCFSTLTARDAVEFRTWVSERRAAGSTPEEHDAYLSAIVRQIARGQRLEPWVDYRRTEAAVREVVEAGVARACGDHVPARRSSTRESDPTVAIFWHAVLAPDNDISVRDRLRAFNALEEAGALPRCTCKPEPEDRLVEEQVDATRATVVRIVAQRHYRAALVVASHPETYVAVQEAVDAAVIDAKANED